MKQKSPQKSTLISKAILVDSDFQFTENIIQRYEKTLRETDVRRVSYAIMLLFAGSILVSAATTAQPQTVEEFYAKTSLRMIIGNPPGGDYDLGGRVMARHLERHVPGRPAIIVQNMPGASGLTAANHLYSVAPRDGSVIGSFSRNLPGLAALNPSKIKIDFAKFNWIGASSLPSRVCVSWGSSKIQKAEDLFSRELIVGSAGAGSVPSLVPTALNSVLNTKFRIVEGYKGTNEIFIAMERGEVDGLCTVLSFFQTVHPQTLLQKKVNVLFNVEETKIDIPGVPSIFDFAKTSEQKHLLQFVFSSAEFGRPFVAPPGAPGDRVAALQEAFKNMLADESLLAEAEKLKLDMTYRSPESLRALVTELSSTPEETREKVNKLLQSQ